MLSITINNNLIINDILNMSIVLIVRFIAHMIIVLIHNYLYIRKGGGNR